MYMFMYMDWDVVFSSFIKKSSLLKVLVLTSLADTTKLLFISRRAEGPGRQILKHPLSVRQSIRQSIWHQSSSHSNSKKYSVFPQTFADTCTRP